MEALIHHFKLVTEGFRVPPGEAYVPIEGPRGELGCFVVADGSAKPVRVHMRDPSFVNLQALREMCVDGYIADMIVNLAMLDPILGGSTDEARSQVTGPGRSDPGVSEASVKFDHLRGTPGLAEPPRGSGLGGGAGRALIRRRSRSPTRSACPRSCGRRSSITCRCIPTTARPCCRR